MTTETVTIHTHVADGIARLTLHAPPLNILTRVVLADLRAALRDLQYDTTIRVLLLAAEGRHFSAGASVPEHMPPECDQMLSEFCATVLALRAFPVPVIAAVQGRCLGGAFELVQAADLIVAADDARFGQPEIVLGVLAPIACALLPVHVGPARAAELLYTGEPWSAQQAAAAGLVVRVVAGDALQDQALALATRIATHSAAALRLTKRALRGADEMTTRSDIARATRTYAHDLMATTDAIEGLQAFMEKRTPQWRHQ